MDRNLETRISSGTVKSPNVEDQASMHKDPIVDSDDEFILPIDFNASEARNQLLNFPNCSKIILSQEQQREMAVEIGVNVTAEYPWKQIKKEVVMDYLMDSSPEIIEFKKKIVQMDNDEYILIGYAAVLSEEDDVFILFENSDVAKDASELIEKIEAFERRTAKKSLIKHPKKWKSLGSEREVDLMKFEISKQIVDIEVQSVYPVNHPHEPFQMRLVDDVRDGYIELIPRKSINYDNINRKRVDISVQTAPPRIHLEQQTDPTFPGNAWSQYLYEIKPNKTEDETEEAVKQAKRRGAKNPTSEPVIPSDRVEDLLNTLEFNEVDMYRNDYPFIGKTNVSKFTVPYLNEEFCFADFSKTLDRYVCAMDWNPIYSGLLLVSYTFSTPATVIKNSDKTDVVKRAVLSSNPVLLWSFDDTLQPKLEFETPREVTAISFCPYDDNLIIGGTINGQLIFWDAKDRLKKVETEEYLTPSQIKYRTAMRSFLDWTKQHNQDKIVRPVAMSSLQTSQKAAITSIQWMNRKFYVAGSGNIRESRTDIFRYIVTSSLDGTIAFWDIDCKDMDEMKKHVAMNSRKKYRLPAHMMGEESVYAKLNGIFRPVFVIIYNRPITAMIFDSATFKYESIAPKNANNTMTTRVAHKVIDIPLEKFSEVIFASTFLGSVSCVAWEGSELGAELIKKETIKQAERFADVHDGPITCIDRNPFIPELFLAVGRSILALWQSDLRRIPIFWRRRSAQISACKWSKDRPAVFFVTLANGLLEAWDIMQRTDEPCLTNSLGGNILTNLSQHKLSIPHEAIAIGDFNSNLRLFKIPHGLSLTENIVKQCEELKTFVAKEVTRKEHLLKWQEAYYDGNADIREAKKRFQVEEKAQLEKLEKELKESEDMRIRKEEEEIRRAKMREKSTAVYDLPQRLDKKWDDMNIKRLMKVLMSLKMVDPDLLAIWTKPEKDRLAYNEKKRKAVSESFKRINADLDEIRARLMPVEEDFEDRITHIRQNIRYMDSSDSYYFDSLMEETLANKSSHQKRVSLEYSEIVNRGRQRREVINKRLGSNTKHRHSYYTNKTI